MKMKLVSTCFLLGLFSVAKGTVFYGVAGFNKNLSDGKVSSNSFFLTAMMSDGSKISTEALQFMLVLNCVHQTSMYLLVASNGDRLEDAYDAMKTEWYPEVTTQLCGFFKVVKQPDFVSDIPNRIDRLQHARDYQRMHVQDLLAENYADLANSIIGLVDLDLHSFPLPSELVKQVARMKESSEGTGLEVDVLCAAGVEEHQDIDGIVTEGYYDTFATVLEDGTFLYPVKGRVHDDGPRKEENASMIISEDFTPIDVLAWFKNEGAFSDFKGNFEMNPVPVKSCFGGLTLYRADKWLDERCSYNGGQSDRSADILASQQYANRQDNRTCEHVVFHACLQEFHPNITVAVQPDLRTQWVNDKKPNKDSATKSKSQELNSNIIEIERRRLVSVDRHREDGMDQRRLLPNSDEEDLERELGALMDSDMSMTKAAKSVKPPSLAKSTKAPKRRRLKLSLEDEDRDRPEDELDEQADETENPEDFLAIWYNDGSTKLVSLPHEPQLAWLMSFPNSGTSYTMRLIESVTGNLIASNYRKEAINRKKNHLNSDDPILITPVYAEQRHGPFYLNEEMQRDHNGLVVTKTHCGLYNFDDEKDRNVRDFDNFFTLCASDQEDGATPLAHIEKVKKAIHLVRDPFDNAVSRIHHEQKVGRLHNVADASGGTLGTNEMNLIRGQCFIHNDLPNNVATLGSFLTPHQFKMIEDVPCRTDFVKYVLWHNKAFEATDHDLTGAETMLIHYDSYQSDFEGTVTSLISFLEMQEEYIPPLFSAGKVYGSYFTKDERSNVKKVFKELASESTWKALRRYFDEPSLVHVPLS